MQQGGQGLVDQEGQQHIQRAAESSAEGDQFIDLGQGAVALPFGDGLTRYAERFRQVLLRNAGCSAQLDDFLTDRHKKILLIILKGKPIQFNYNKMSRENQSTSP